ncbi:NADPH-dependent FMN reductase [Natronincola peptidivorans]|uniref:NADPH-dependent FMN reductase n=1 Tax=Natronincola peptidivorans TaxID=426128 RepID=A0A1I0FY25_9FIRM|nr:flavodoxin family protein [Natronincola peptidivorans]SET63452.1 NADPH-dependent FMN reductase [Natronincola peptidivorans]
MIKVLAIVGSPRKGKNNDTIVTHMLEGIENTLGLGVFIEKLYADDLAVQPCKACDGCTRVRGCILEDAMRGLYEKFDESDIIIMASPLYFNSISAQLKTIIDRNQAIWSSKYILNNSLINKDKNRLGYFICTAGMPEIPDLFEAAIPIMELYFKSINTGYEGNFFVANVDEHPIMRDEKILQQAYSIGISLADKILTMRTQ